MTSVSRIIAQYYEIHTDLPVPDPSQIKAGSTKSVPTINLHGALRRSSRSPRSAIAPFVTLGMPLYNETENLSEALASLAAQTYTNFELVIRDDSTKPGAGEIAQAFAARHPFVRYVRNDRRKGMVGNWRSCFEARDSQSKYFAWVGDHDAWDPGWLSAMVDTLEADQHAVLAYPASIRVHSDGRDAERFSQVFDTAFRGVLGRIFTLAVAGNGYGNMIYGLFRADAVKRCGVFPATLVPDVVMLWELALEGTFRQVHAHLWKRRHIGLASIARQRRSLFVRSCWYAYLPWPLTNACLLLWRRALKLDAGGLRSRGRGLTLATVFFVANVLKILDGTPAETAGRFLRRVVGGARRRLDSLHRRFLRFAP